MNKFKIFSLAFIATASFAQAQDVDDAKKSIDAEQYEKAKIALKNILQAKPSNGKAAFLLGNVYLQQGVEDSARISFQKGLSASDDGNFNNIGLGQLDLNGGKTLEAKAKFDLATKDMRRKDIEEYIYIANAYMNAAKPDYTSAIAILNKAKAASPDN